MYSVGGDKPKVKRRSPKPKKPREIALETENDLEIGLTAELSEEIPIVSEPKRKK
jgi:hypothetical protein